MQLRHIAWASLKRRKGRFAFLLVALTLGIGTVVALVALSTAMRADVSDELDRFGANIIITPKSRSLDLAYGGLAVGGLTVDARALTTEDARRVRTIPNKRNISAVAPKLVGTIDIDGRRVLVIGADLFQESGIKSWWEVHGRLAKTPDEVMLGAEAAQLLAKNVGDSLILNEQFTRFAYAVSVVVLLVGALVVMTTMMAAVTERTQEIGILRAVGFRRTQVARVILLEAVGINLVGGVIGWAAGMLAARGLGPALAQLASPVAVDPRLALLAIALAMLLGAGGGTYPALRAARMDPTQALRHI